MPTLKQKPDTRQNCYYGQTVPINTCSISLIRYFSMAYRAINIAREVDYPKGES